MEGGKTKKVKGRTEEIRRRRRMRRGGEGEEYGIETWAYAVITLGRPP